MGIDILDGEGAVVREVDKISVRTIYQWNHYTSGFLSMYFVSISKFELPKNLLKT